MKKQAIILGAGISGLSLAWFLKQKYQDNIAIKIFEKTNRAGGLIQTKKSSQGYLFEQGPHSFRNNSLETLELIEELNLKHELITANPSAKTRYLFAKNQLNPLPRGFFEFICSPYFKMALKAVWQDLRTPQTTLNDESIFQFVSRRLGSQIAEQLFDPLVSGIYAGNIKQLSIAACFPDLQHLEQEHGGIIKGLIFQKKKKKARSSIFSFKNGMEELPRRLAELMCQDIHYNSEVSSIQSNRNQIEITLTNGITHSADHLYSALPAKTLANLINIKILNDIPYASLAVINIGFKQDVLSKKGFGYLIPSKENQSTLGVIFDSCVFPQQQPLGNTCMTLILGGMHHPNLLDFDDNTLKSKALQLLASHLNINDEPNELTIHRIPVAIPQYPVGYKQLMSTIAGNLIPNLTLAGNFAGVSVNDCIANSKRIVNNCKKWE